VRDELKARIEEVLESLSGKRTLTVSGLLSPPSNRLVHVLSAGVPGDELTDDDIRQISGLDGEKAYSAEQSAIKHARRAHDVWWKRSPRTGSIRCLDAAGRVSFAGSDIKTAGRRARRAVKAASAADVPQELMAKRDVVLAQAGAMATLASASTVKNLMGETKKAPPEIAELKALVERMSP